MPKTNDRRTNRISKITQAGVLVRLEHLGKTLTDLEDIATVGYAHGFIKEPALTPNFLCYPEVIQAVTDRANAHYERNYSCSDHHFASCDITIVLASLSALIIESMSQANKGGESNRKKQVSGSK